MKPEPEAAGGHDPRIANAMRVVIDSDLVVDRAAWRAAREINKATTIEYIRYVPRYKAWCQPPSHGERPARWLTPLPGETDTLTAYVDALCQQGLAPSTIGKHVSAVLWWHRLHGQPVPDGRPASVLLSDYKARRKAAGLVPKRAVPLPLDALVLCLGACDRGRRRGRRDAAVLLLAYASMIPPARLVKLRIRDVSDSAAGLYLRTDDGPMTLPHWTIGGQHHPALCVVEAVVEWVRIMLAAGARPEGPLISPVDVHDNIAGLDRWAGGPHDGWMEPNGPGYLFTALLVAAGVPDPGRYSLRSLRAGGIIKRRHDGAPIGQLAAEAGLSTTSPVLVEYLLAAEATAPASLVGPDAELAEVTP
jgi:hypothetical protein